MRLSEIQKFAEKTALAAGQLLLRSFGRTRITVQKSPSDFATAADLASERLICQAIKRQFPQHAILAEESAYSQGSAATGAQESLRWVIDPLDGTKNFYFGLPFWCVSLALQSYGESVIGVVYCPVTGELYSARKGGGAKCNGKKIQVSTQTEVSRSTALLELPRRQSNTKGISNKLKTDLECLLALQLQIQRSRAFGAAAYSLALVARGAAEAYVDLARNTRIWDIAAGELLVREAGGRTSRTTDSTIDPTYASVLATNAAVHMEFLEILDYPSRESEMSRSQRKIR